jgi:hypothetical protein
MTISFTYSGLPKNVRCPFFVAEVTQRLEDSCGRGYAGKLARLDCDSGK